MIVNGEPLEFCINFQDNPFKLIVGGYSTCMSIYDVTKDYNDFTTQFRVKENVLKVCKWIVSVKPRWKGSRLGDDFIWFKDCVVLNDAEFANNGSTNDNDPRDLTVYSVSKFGMLFKFKPGLTKVCVNKCLVSNYSLRSILKLSDHLLMLVDSFNLMSIYDTLTDEVVKTFSVPLVGPISGVELVRLDAKDGRSLLYPDWIHHAVS
ncbi:unnamed protein product [Ambrosiozyma monospora]|uniref:Unnamed protein product n=1 Tax=Ambrosiozyma monospora TaxID=43982 RepID=A0ACB5U3I2_AMBMO|nr:unnamed protein product [Ambrosiozyma monospora]